MPNPTQDSLRVNQYLTNISIQYKNPSYIADQIFPIVGVEMQAGIVPKYNQSHWFRDSAQLRAPGTRSQRGGFKIDKTDTYYCPRFSWGFEVPDEVKRTANSQGVFNLDRDGAQFVTEKGLLKREVAFAADFFKTGVWGVDKTGGTDFTQWNDYAASTPLIDLETYKDDMEASIGREPNTLLLGKQVWVQLKWHPDLVDTIKYTQRGVMSPEIFSGLIELPRILIGRSIRVTSAEGVAESSATYARIFGKAALLAWVPDAPSLLAPAAGYTFTWNPAGGPQYIKTMRDEESEMDIIEINTYFDQKATAIKAGTFLATAVA